MKTFGIDLIPGNQLCPAGNNELNSRQKPVECDTDIISHVEPDFNEQTEIVINESREKLNSSLNEMELSPFKVHSIARHSLISHGKKKLKQTKSQ